MNYLSVWVGDKYGSGYVGKMRSMLKRHGEPGAAFIVLTDKPTTASAFCDLAIDISGLELPGWWSKMALLNPAIRGWEPAVYFDLDTVLVGDITKIPPGEPFGICANFTRAAGNLQWPCKYGSCCMTFDGFWGSEVWAAFERDRERIMRNIAGRYGDQKAIEHLVHPAEVTILQEKLPRFFFTGYRDLVQYRDEPPPDCSVVVFAGTHKPDNCEVEWVRREWQ